ncbi:hypothetical protein JCM33774_51400 [Actinophytocola sp. KF-1]
MRPAPSNAPYSAGCLARSQCNVCSTGGAAAPIAPSTAGPTASRWSCTTSMSSRSRNSRTTRCMCAVAQPITWLYGRSNCPNWGRWWTCTRSSATSLLSPTVASTTRTPCLRSSGTNVATTFSIPP